MLDENLLSIGRRSALERAAYLLAFLCVRSRAVGLGPIAGAKGRKGPDLPLTQQHVADTLGLSVVHTNKTVRKLAQRGLIRWSDGGCEVLDIDGLLEVAGWPGLDEKRRPLV